MTELQLHPTPIVPNNSASTKEKGAALRGFTNSSSTHQSFISDRPNFLTRQNSCASIPPRPRLLHEYRPPAYFPNTSSPRIPINVRHHTTMSSSLVNWRTINIDALDPDSPANFDLSSLTPDVVPVSAADVQHLATQCRQLLRGGDSEGALRGALENAPYGGDERGKVGSRSFLGIYHQGWT